MRSALSHVALAGLIGHFGHASVEQFARAINDGFPLEGGTGIGLVGLNMVMTKNALVLIQFFIGQLLRNQLSIGVMGVIAFDFWKNFAKRRGQLDERLILLRSKIVLEQFLTLNCPPNQFGSRRMADETFGANAAVAKLLRDRDADLAVAILGVPFFQCIAFVGMISAHVGDFDADGTTICDCRVPGAFFEVQRLIDRAVEIEHEMDTEIAMVVQDFEALTADAADVEMDYKLIDHLLEQGQIPSAAANALDFVVRQAGAAQAETVWIPQIRNFFNRLGPIGFVNRTEASLDTVSVITTRIHPEDNGRAGVNKLAGDHDFVSATRFKGARPGRGLATHQKCRGSTGDRKQPQLTNPANDKLEHADICPRKCMVVKQKSHIVM